jgi:hypothetical protein
LLLLFFQLTELQHGVLPCVYPHLETKRQRPREKCSTLIYMTQIT